MKLAYLNPMAGMLAGALLATLTPAQDDAAAALPEPGKLELRLSADSLAVHVGFRPDLKALAVVGASESPATHRLLNYLPPILADIQVYQFFIIANGVEFELRRFVKDYYAQFVALDLSDITWSGSEVITVGVKPDNALAAPLTH